MPTFKSTQLLDTLEQTVAQTIHNATLLQSMGEAALKTVPALDKWNVLQVLYHLNSYNNYYLPHIAQATKEGENIPYSATFKAGVIGNYFTNMMLPGNNGMVKNVMKAPKDHSPAGDFTDIEVVNEFVAGQQKLLQLLGEARGVNLTRIKVPISISTLIKLRLGDTFRFLVAHQQRHFVQISNTLKANGMAFSV